MRYNRNIPVVAAAFMAAAFSSTTVFAQNDPLEKALKDGVQNIEQTSRAIEYLFRQLAPRPSEGITPLMRASRSNDLNQVKKLVAEGTDVDATSRFGWTALMFAAMEGHKESVSILLDAGADPNLVSKRITGNTQAPTPKTTALAEAIKKNHLELAGLLLNRGAKPDPTSVAIAGGLEDLSLIKRMHAAGADLNQKGNALYYPSALVMACKHGRLGNVEWILDQGVKPEYQALATAVGQDQVEAVRFLIRYDKHDHAYSDRDRSAALVHAATKHTKAANYHANLQIIELLLTSGADRDYRAKHGQTRGSTALEFLQKKRVQALNRIEQNRYGASQQSWEKAWLQHRDNIIRILEGDDA